MGSTMRLVGRSVLIIEDEPLIALELKELLETEGAKVEIALSPTDALRLIDMVAFSGAVLDFGSRDDENAPLCRTLREHQIPFMYYTEFDGLDESSLGAPILTKPASAEAVIAMVNQLSSLTPHQP